MAAAAVEDSPFSLSTCVIMTVVDLSAFAIRGGEEEDSDKSAIG